MLTMFLCPLLQQRNIEITKSKRHKLPLDQQQLEELRRTGVPPTIDSAKYSRNLGETLHYFLEIDKIHIYTIPDSSLVILQLT